MPVKKVLTGGGGITPSPTYPFPLRLRDTSEAILRNQDINKVKGHNSNGVYIYVKLYLWTSLIAFCVRTTQHFGR